MSSSHGVEFDPSLVPKSLVKLTREEALALPPEQYAVLKITTALSSIRGLVELERPLLELTFEVLPAERGAVILLDPASSFGWGRGADGAVRICRPIFDQVLHEGVALLSNEVDDGGRRRSVMAAPLLVFDSVLGLIYLDTADREAPFDTHHLHTLTSVASVAAMSLDYARRLNALESENRQLLGEINLGREIIGDSPQMQAVLQFIGRVAPRDATVLVRGESGTGKELVARAIHRNSARAAGPFFAINCAAITETLLESELFGYEKGAFTGAAAMTKGKLEAADGGTVFLDEIGEMAPHLQARLLRVLQEREFTRVGGTKSIKLDVRIVAATNRDLEEGIRKGTFREDLYYRLNVVSLRMPPLRDRRKDIIQLAQYFVQKHSARAGRRVTGVSPEASAFLQQYDWPGNVRELENAIERAVVLGSTEAILPDDLPEPVLDRGTPAELAPATYHEAVREAKRQIVRKSVEQAGGNYAEAARRLGVNVTYLHRLIRNLDLRGLRE
jgi:transcriptional regulator with GAF, ATPase, and Fis domain